MGYCSHCGALVTANTNFCQCCGNKIQSNEKRDYEYATSNEGCNYTNDSIHTKEYRSEDVENNKLMAVLSYLGVLVLIPYMKAKDSPFVRFHVQQGCTLFVCQLVYIVLYYVLTQIKVQELYGLLSVTPWWIMTPLTLLQFCLIALTCIGIYHVVIGSDKELPLIGKYKIIPTK